MILPSGHLLVLPHRIIEFAPTCATAVTAVINLSALWNDRVPDGRSPNLSWPMKPFWYTDTVVKGQTDSSSCHLLTVTTVEPKRSISKWVLSWYLSCPQSWLQDFFYLRTISDWRSSRQGKIELTSDHTWHSCIQLSSIPTPGSWLPALLTLCTARSARHDLCCGLWADAWICRSKDKLIPEQCPLTSNGFGHPSGTKYGYNGGGQRFKFHRDKRRGGECHTMH